MSHGRVSYGVYLTGVHLTGVHLIYLIGVHLMGMHLIGVHLMGMHLIGMHLMGIHLIGVHLMGVHLIDVHLIGVHLLGVTGYSLLRTVKVQLLCECMSGRISILVSAGRDPCGSCTLMFSGFVSFRPKGAWSLSGEALVMCWLRASLGGGERLELCVGRRAEILAATAHESG
jgi:hypothetical protein